MFKKVFLLSLTIVAMTMAKAQNVEETTVQFSDFQVTAYTVSVPQDVKFVQKAMKNRLKEANLVTENSNGYTASLNQKFDEISTVPINFYYKIQEQGRRSDKSTNITVFAMTTNTGVEQTGLGEYTSRFLSNFVTYVNRAEAAEKLSDEEKQLKKRQKEYSSAVSDLTKIEKSIADNEKKINNKQAEIEKLNSNIQTIQSEIERLQDQNAKNADVKSKAEQTINEAQNLLKQSEDNVARYKAILE